MVIPQEPAQIQVKKTSGDGGTKVWVLSDDGTVEYRIHTGHIAFDNFDSAIS